MYYCVNCGNELSGNKTKFCCNECKKTHLKNNSYYYQTIRGLKRKLKLIESFGGKCSNCGYDKNIASLQFHHLRDKSFQLDMRNLSNRKMETILEESLKCILLCANCHTELHNPEMDKESIKENLQNELEKYKETKPKNSEDIICSCGKTKYRYSTVCKECGDLEKRKVKDRPSKELLLSLLETKTKKEVAKNYGVSATTINRWLI